MVAAGCAWGIGGFFMVKDTGDTETQFWFVVKSPSLCPERGCVRGSVWVECPYTRVDTADTGDTETHVAYARAPARKCAPYSHIEGHLE
jgi:hypothetical protein